MWSVTQFDETINKAYRSGTYSSSNNRNMKKNIHIQQNQTKIFFKIKNETILHESNRDH